MLIYSVASTEPEPIDTVYSTWTMPTANQRIRTKTKVIVQALAAHGGDPPKPTKSPQNRKTPNCARTLLAR